MGSVPQGSPPSTSILSRNNNSCFVFLTVVVNLMTQSWHDSSNVYLTAHMHTRMTRPHTRPPSLSPLLMGSRQVKASQGIGYGVWVSGQGFPSFQVISPRMLSIPLIPCHSPPFAPFSCARIAFLCCLSGPASPLPTPTNPNQNNPKPSRTVIPHTVSAPVSHNPSNQKDPPCTILDTF